MDLAMAGPGFHAKPGAGERSAPRGWPARPPRRNRATRRPACILPVDLVQHRDARDVADRAEASRPLELADQEQVTATGRPPCRRLVGVATVGAT